MPFTEENKPLLEAAAAIVFQFRKNGSINSHKHNPYERGLYFVQRAAEIHGNKFGYSKVTYVNNSTKVTIRCSIHGNFEMTPANHLKGQHCSKCTGKYSPTTEEFTTMARSVHGNKYDYSHAKYKSRHEKLAIGCYQHGLFYTTPANHIYNKRGCSKCSGNYSPNTEEFIEKARNVHGDKYDYSKVVYKNNKEIIEIICPIHGSFFPTPTNHLSFKGCPRCAGKNHDILYLLKCLETGWYKIGITTGVTKNRISSIGGKLEEIHHVKLEDPGKHESILHKRYTKYREYNLCVRDGCTEFFSLTEEQVQEVIAYMDEVSKIA